MLYHKLITLSISCIIQVRKLHNDVTHSLTKISATLSEYLNGMNPIFKEKVIKNYLSLKVNKVDPYLINDDVSNEFSTLIKDDLLENMCYVIELNPGHGLLTRRLLEAGVPFMHLYENHGRFYHELQNLEVIFPNRVKITRANLLKMHKMLDINKACSVSNSPNIHLCELYNNIPKRKWEDKSCMQVIGTVIEPLFLRHLLLSVVFQTGFMMHGRTIFYLALSPSIWNVSTINLDFFLCTCQNSF